MPGMRESRWRKPHWHDIMNTNESLRLKDNWLKESNYCWARRNPAFLKRPNYVPLGELGGAGAYVRRDDVRAGGAATIADDAGEHGRTSTAAAGGSALDRRRPKAEVLAECSRDINPGTELTVVAKYCR